MQRVAIIGVSGSGKSWLAVRLADAVGLPLYHLDRLHWSAGWKGPPKDAWRALQESLVQKPSWIIDGNYFGTLELRLSACDTVVWLDLPTWVCVASLVWRYVTYRGRTRPDLAPDCPEKLDWAFLRWVATYRKRGRPKTLRLLSKVTAPTRIVHLTSRREVRRWLERIERDARADMGRGGISWHSS